MPAYMIRIMLLLITITLLSFIYESISSSKAIKTTGEIVSISSKAKGREIEIYFSYPDKNERVFTCSVGPIVDLLMKYNVGDKIPILYCEDCYPAARIGDILNRYSLTLMIFILDLITFLILSMAWWKDKNKMNRDQEA